MWDVKILSLFIATSPVMFYLNYVGCKVTFVSKLVTLDTVFYLNYVGCKGVSGVPVLTYNKKCFTLTMWDVKFFVTWSEN